MNSIGNMQSNCTLLNVCLKELYPDFKYDYCENNTIDGAALAYAFRCSPFYGNTGDIIFNAGSSLRAAFPMNLYQFQPGKSPVIIGNFVNGTINFYDNYYFPGGETPTSAIVVDDPSFDDAFVVAFFVLDIVLIVITLGLLLFIVLKRNNRVVRNSGSVSSILVLVGILALEIAVIFMSLSLSPAICCIIDVFTLLGVSFIISTLAAKLYRIYRIFQNPTAQAISITDIDLVYFTCAITLGSAIIFILYVVLGGGLIAVVKIAPLNTLYQFNICEVPNGTFQTTFLLVFYAYFVCLFVAAAVLAFLTRNTRRDFNESLNVSFVVYSWIAVALIYAPIYYVQGSSTNSNQTRYIVRYIAIDLVIIITLGVLFWNKVRRVLRSERKERKSVRESVQND